MIQRVHAPRAFRGQVSTMPGAVSAFRRAVRHVRYKPGGRAVYMGTAPVGLGFSLKPPKFIRKAAKAVKKNVTLKRVLVAGAVVGAAFIPGVAPAALALAKGAGKGVLSVVKGAGKGAAAAARGVGHGIENLFRPKPKPYGPPAPPGTPPAETPSPDYPGQGTPGTIPGFPGSTGGPSAPYPDAGTLPGGGGGGFPPPSSAVAPPPDETVQTPDTAGMNGNAIVPLLIGVGIVAMAMNSKPPGRRRRRR